MFNVRSKRRRKSFSPNVITGYLIFALKSILNIFTIAIDFIKEVLFIEWLSDLFD